MFDGRTCSRGFSLLELMVTTSVMTVLGSMGVLAVQSATTSANVARAKADADVEARAVASFLAAEIQLASKELGGGNSVRITQAPFAGCGLEAAFTVPGIGSMESRDIRYQWLIEDVDGDGVLDPGEDTIIADETLSGRILRIERIARPEGEPIEVTTIVGGAHHVSGIEFVENGNLMKIVARSAKPIAGTRRVDPESGGIENDCVEAASVARVYLMN